MPKLKFEPTGDEVELPEGSLIQEVCEEAGVPFACTEGVCGTCVIEVKEGVENFNSPTEEEKDFFGDDCESLDCPERLACQCKFVKDGQTTISF